MALHTPQPRAPLPHAPHHEPLTTRPHHAPAPCARTTHRTQTSPRAPYRHVPCIAHHVPHTPTRPALRASLHAHTTHPAPRTSLCAPHCHVPCITHHVPHTTSHPTHPSPHGRTLHPAPRQVLHITGCPASLTMCLALPRAPPYAPHPLRLIRPQINAALIARATASPLHVSQLSLSG